VLRLLFIATLAAGIGLAADPPGTRRIVELGGVLQRDSAGHIVEADLTFAWLADDDLALLAAMPELRKINLSHTKITDLGLAHLRPLQKVTRLICYYCDYITDGGIAYLKQWRDLELLNIRGTEITSRVFEHLANMKKLRALDVGFSRVNDDGFDALANLEALEELHIGGDKMSGLALPLLRLLPSLKRLDVNGSQRTDSGRWGLMLTDVNFESITALTRLEELNIGGTNVSDVGIKGISSLVNLHALDLSRMELTAKGLEPLAALPQLRRLSLYESVRIDDGAAERLIALKNLEILDLTGTSITDASLERIATMAKLKTVFLSSPKVTPAAVERFRNARPDCRVIHTPKFKDVTSPEDTRLTG
jgi:Leucine-rich repeat (LRR) protein